MKRGATVIKRSPIVIVRNFLALQFASAGLYIFAGSMAYYAQLWRSYELTRLVPFQLAQVVFLFVVETVLIFYIFLAWYRQTVRISADQLVYDQGVVFRRHTIVPLDKVASSTFTQSVLGKLTHYGTVSLRGADGQVLLHLTGMPEPQQFIDELMASHRPSGTVPAVDPQHLLGDEEHEQLERKSTLRWDLSANKVNKNLEKAALKTVAAFLNTEGGHLMLGIADDRSVVGLEHDYATLARKDADGLTNHFGNLFNTMLGAHVRHLVQLKPFSTQAKECMLVSVAPSPRPVYLSDEGKEEFFVRTGNGTTSLKLSEAASYIDAHWDGQR